MKIAMLASNFIRIPPTPKYVPQGRSGATEKVVHRIAESLVTKGHDVTLFASGDSKTSAKLVSVTKKSSAKDKNIGFEKHEAYENLLISEAYQRAKQGEFDIIHSHFDTKTAYYAPLVNTPTVSTIHSPLKKRADILRHFKETQHYVSISDNQRLGLPDLNYAATIHHGINTSSFYFDPKGKDYLLYIGRIAPQKGVDLAIRAAQDLSQNLIICGWARKIYQKYYNEEIKPHIDGKKVKLYGFLSRNRLKAFIRHAKILLFPIKWEEPFGLVMIEAMASGTPVVAFSRGSVPEVVNDGITGYIVNSSAIEPRGEYIIKKRGYTGFRQAVNKILSMEIDQYRKMRGDCRRHVEENFSIEKMVKEYEKVYHKILVSSK